MIDPNTITPEMHRDFLIDATRRCLTVLDRLNLYVYFDALNRQDPHALALLAIHDKLRLALCVVEDGRRWMDATAANPPPRAGEVGEPRGQACADRADKSEPGGGAG